MGRKLRRNENFNQPANPSGNSNSQKMLMEAIAKRDRFLSRYPKYRSYQREIDHILDKAGTSKNRMAVLAFLMEAKLIELRNQMVSLNQIVNHV